MIGRKPLTSINVEVEEQINILMTETDLIHTIGVSKMIDSLLNNIIKFRYIFYILLILKFVNIPGKMNGRLALKFIFYWPIQLKIKNAALLRFF